MGGVIQTQINPTLRSAPHEGSLDHALETCTSLTELAVEWSLVGARFVRAIEATPLHTLVLLGSPQHTAAADFITVMQTRMPTLKYLNLICFGTQANQAQSWSARDVRQLRRACEQWVPLSFLYGINRTDI